METLVKASQGRNSGSPSGWTVTVGLDIPNRPEVARHPKFYEHLSAILAGRGPAFKQTATQLVVTFGSPDHDYRAARKDADGCVSDLLHSLELKTGSVKQLRLTANDDLDKELGKLPSCVGVGEAADILGVTKQRVAQLAQREDFPTPVFRLRATPVWRDSDVRRFASSRQTTPGPARKRA